MNKNINFPLLLFALYLGVIFFYSFFFSINILDAEDNLNATIISENQIEISNLKNEIDKLQNTQKKLKKYDEDIKQELNSLKFNQSYLQYDFANKLQINDIKTYQHIDNIKKEIKQNSEKILNNNININQNIDDINGTLIKLHSQLIEQKQFSDKSQNDLINSKKQMTYMNNYLLFIIIIIFIVIALLFISFFYLKKSLLNIVNQLHVEKNNSKNELKDELIKLKEDFNNQIFKADTKLAEMLEQIIILSSDKKNMTISQENDHSLTLKVADEITRINKNISNINPETRGLKQLSASINRILDNFMANGYEIIDMLNKPYNEGMKVQATFKTNENLKANEFIITRIIKPQINYKGTMIQAAHVEVSFNDELTNL